MRLFWCILSIHCIWSEFTIYTEFAYYKQFITLRSDISVFVFFRLIFFRLFISHLALIRSEISILHYRVSKKNLTPFIFKLAASRQEFDNSHVYRVSKKKLIPFIFKLAASRQELLLKYLIMYTKHIK